MTAQPSHIQAMPACGKDWTCPRKKWDRAPWAASAQGCLPTSGQTLWDAEFSKCFKSQLKHRDIELSAKKHCSHSLQNKTEVSAWSALLVARSSASMSLHVQVFAEWVLNTHTHTHTRFWGLCFCFQVFSLLMGQCQLMIKDVWFWNQTA